MKEKNTWPILLILAASLFGGCNNAPSSADGSTTSQNTSTASPNTNTASQNTSANLNCQQFIEALAKKNPNWGRLSVKQEQKQCHVKPEKSADINFVKSALFYQQWGGPGIEKIGKGVDNVRLESDFVTIYFELL